jgi:hypothetical protein
MRIRLERPRRLHTVVEWRYPKAHRYWDDCGKLITEVESAFPGLKAQSLGSDGFKFTGDERGITSANFYWEKAAIEQDGGQGDSWIGEAADLFWELVKDGLNISEVNRIGHRTFSLFETERPAVANRYLEERSIWHFSPSSEALGTPISAGAVLRTVLPDSLRRLRLELQAGTMKARERSYHGVIADTDIVIEKPAAIPTTFRDFVEDNQTLIRESIDPILRGR